eukprot:scaffold2879_cov269-Prasinococcus_capsulatus_cf.AAC.32
MHTCKGVILAGLKGDGDSERTSLASIVAGGGAVVCAAVLVHAAVVPKQSIARSSVASTSVASSSTRRLARAGRRRARGAPTNVISDLVFVATVLDLRCAAPHPRGYELSPPTRSRKKPVSAQRHELRCNGCNVM